ncbi:MAG: hypothetical protein AMJ55_02955 [Gammaproteobacteria bacterium SG8_15]|nr:MAG: hypothetical protein AMJ55_02955 [Gammaproteobacteria bacterium SG8_15]
MANVPKFDHFTHTSAAQPAEITEITINGHRYVREDLREDADDLRICHLRLVEQKMIQQMVQSIQDIISKAFDEVEDGPQEEPQEW